MKRVASVKRVASEKWVADVLDEMETHAVSGRLPAGQLAGSERSIKLSNPIIRLQQAGQGLPCLAARESAIRLHQGVDDLCRCVYTRGTELK